MKMFLAMLCTVSLLGVPLHEAGAAQTRFYIGDAKERDVVKFTSDAPLELITGQTGRIKGSIAYDEGFQFDAKHPFDVRFTVDLNSLNSGISLRDEHMRNNFLQTASFPEAVFQVTRIQTTAKPPFKNGQVVNILATGDFTLHGKTMQKTIPLKVTYFPQSTATKSRFKSGNLIRIQGEFPVKLAEHNIQRPKVMFETLADTVYVSLDAMGTDDPSALK